MQSISLDHSFTINSKPSIFTVSPISILFFIIIKSPLSLAVCRPAVLLSRVLSTQNLRTDCLLRRCPAHINHSLLSSGKSGTRTRCLCISARSKTHVYSPYLHLLCPPAERAGRLKLIFFFFLENILVLGKKECGGCA